MTARALTLLSFGLAAASTVALFVSVGSTPCDTSLPVQSDGTRQPPGSWGDVWLASLVAAILLFGFAGGMASRHFGARPLPQFKALLVGLGAALLWAIVLYALMIVFWGQQCPTS